MFFSLLVADYVPILTHPERLTWISSHYETVQRLVRAGVWMQITAGSLTGAFGRNARYWGERMLDEGYVHILATDAHDVSRRPPNLSQGRALAEKRVGDAEAQHLVFTRPRGILLNDLPSNQPKPERAASPKADVLRDVGDVATQTRLNTSRDLAYGNFVGRLRRLFE